MTGPILLLTRPEAASRRFAAQLDLAVETIISPLMQIDPVKVQPIIADLRGIILTSEQGAIAAGRMSSLPRTAWCVGDRTAAAAREEGFQAISADGDALALVSLILACGEKGPLLHIRGEHGRGEVLDRLIAAGVEVRQVIAYRQQELGLSQTALAALHGKRSVILPLFSPRSGTIFAKAAPFSAPLHIVSISVAVTTAVKDLDRQSLTEVGHPDAKAMALGIKASLAGLSKMPVTP